MEFIRRFYDSVEIYKSTYHHDNWGSRGNWYESIEPWGVCWIFRREPRCQDSNSNNEVRLSSKRLSLSWKSVGVLSDSNNIFLPIKMRMKTKTHMQVPPEALKSESVSQLIFPTFWFSSSIMSVCTGTHVKTYSQESRNMKRIYWAPYLQDLAILLLLERKKFCEKCGVCE